MKDWKAIVILLVGLVCLGVISCRSMLDKVTPADIPIISMEYAGIDPNTVGFQSLYKAREIEALVFRTYRERQRTLLWEIEGDKFAYQDARAIRFNIQEAQAWQDLMVGSKDQPISILGILAGAGIAFPVGKILKRRGDYSPEEFKAAIVEAKEQAKKDA